MADAKTVLEFAKKNGAKLLDLRFTDLPGLWQHGSYPINELRADSFEEGFGMDGSSIRGWGAINDSDIMHPDTKQRYARDPRYIAKKAELYLASTGMPDTAYFGAKAEFFNFANI